jgi:hypothetical protein
MVKAAANRRFRLSIRTLMIAIALCALFLAPVGWMYRRLELQRRMEMLAVDHARAQAERAAALARFTQAGFSAPIQGNTVPRIAGNLWAALSANHAVFVTGQTKDLRIEFNLVNDGDEVIDPKMAESHIIINDKELIESGSVLGSVPKEARFNSLAPGESLQFSLLLGNQFKKPGTYRVSWKGAGFQSSEMVLRILPDLGAQTEHNPSED